MFRNWCAVIRSLNVADDALAAVQRAGDRSDRDAYHAALERLHADLRRLDQRNALSRIAAMIAKAES